MSSTETKLLPKIAALPYLDRAYTPKGRRKDGRNHSRRQVEPRGVGPELSMPSAFSQTHPLPRRLEGDRAQMQVHPHSSCCARNYSPWKPVVRAQWFLPLHKLKKRRERKRNISNPLALHYMPNRPCLGPSAYLDHTVSGHKQGLQGQLPWGFLGWPRSHPDHIQRLREAPWHTSSSIPHSPLLGDSRLFQKEPFQTALWPASVLASVDPSQVLYAPRFSPV